ncbi:hypothetical protein BDA99DRAFT_431140 [Phascolomyces articulosus]|uniref:NADH:flavin oxidoreductase/NADH oxidase N-terminal domain-containing protein n=1 Tax=Phascolomyces articulosus TaxID=60185 RepID=A0AAD5K949_9FUNG|nr:hypothetical protein BDA99DRAFT_431473 [Phascolomyces articulosus]KAI9275461.1 hypothetical protein BDA99DRAFT_431140 [Phascolomyces articulosus]
MVALSALFQPVKLGGKQLNHRIVMAPMTRIRADDNHVPIDLIREHYEQRTTEGGLLITEATLISPNAGGGPHIPGLWTREHIDGWRSVVDAVHKKKGVIYNQLWHKGRVSSSLLMPNNVKPVSASAIAIQGKNSAGQDYEVPRALELDEIPQVIQEYATAAKNAVKAGFDGVEIHGASGYLVDQFITSSSNKRTDKYGGSIENRARFALEVIEAVVEAVGPEKTAIRFSPFGGFQDMNDDTPYETWGYILDQLKNKHPNFSYVHFTEPRLNITNDTGFTDTDDSLDPFRAKWDGVFIASGGYTYDPKLAAEVAETTGNLISFGRSFTSNPDLVERLRNGFPLEKYDRSTFYGGNSRGYADFSNYIQQ